MTRLPTFFRPPGSPAQPVMSRRLEESIESAGYWVQRLPREAVHLARRSRLWTVVAALLTLSTGLLAWPVIARSSPLTAQVLLSALAGLAAFAFVLPYLLGLTDRSDESIRLCATYATMYRELLDTKAMLTDGSLGDPSRVADIVGLFERIDGRKEALALPAGAHLEAGVPVGERTAQGGVGGERVPVAAPGIPRPSLPSAQSPPAAAADIDAQALLSALVQVLTSPHVEVRRRVPFVQTYRRHRFRPWAGRTGWTLPGGTRAVLDPAGVPAAWDGPAPGLRLLAESAGTHASPTAAAALLPTPPAEGEVGVAWPRVRQGHAPPPGPGTCTGSGTAGW